MRREITKAIEALSDEQRADFLNQVDSVGWIDDNILRPLGIPFSMRASFIAEDILRQGRRRAPHFIAHDIAKANAQGGGAYHVFADFEAKLGGHVEVLPQRFVGSFRTFEAAKGAAESARNAEIYDGAGKRVFPA